MGAILQAIHDSLLGVTNQRFFNTERGFQGEFSSELRNKLPTLELEGAIVEQEYQKRQRHHGFNIRPDIIVHIPFENSGLSERNEGNFVVIELKHNASREEALEDYAKLSSMCELLNYPLGVFINIASNKTYLDEFEGGFKDRLCAFAVSFDEKENNIIIN